ncbi:MAG: hypothetical protein KJ626_15985 [Verrucomicrobia bacterium]|nr:hypothetical protein [Verrucomicrobiota bacterium]
MPSSIFNFSNLENYRRLPRAVHAWHVAIGLVLAGVLAGSLWLISSVLGHTDYTQLRVDSLEDRYADAEVLFVGTSQTAYGINPTLYEPKAANLSSKGCDYVLLDLALERVMSVATNLKVVVLEAYIYSIRTDIVELRAGDYSDFYAMGLTVWDLPRGLYWKMRQYLRETLLHPVYYMSRLTPRGILWPPKARLIVPRYNDEETTDGYVFHDGIVIDVEHSADMWMANYANDLRYNQYDANVAALLRMAHRVRDAGAQLMILRLPQHYTFREKRPEEWDRQYEGAIEAVRTEIGVGNFAYRDLQAEPVYPDEFFGDAVHMNPTGARFTAGLLKDQIEGLAGVASR